MKYYIVDAFTDELFSGNPAGVCVLENEISYDNMLNIAAENNLSETAFLLKKEVGYHIRWFTPETEFDLCGHATLGASYVVLNYLEPEMEEVVYSSMSGKLKVTHEEDKYILDFPKREPVQIEITSNMQEACSEKIINAYQSRDLFLELENEDAVKNMIPNYTKFWEINQRPEFGVIITSKGYHCDFVSRYFSPNSIVKEDPVTGSAHCSLIPFWGKKLGKKRMVAKQLSKRGGIIHCEELKNRVKIGGKAVCYLEGEIHI